MTIRQDKLNSSILMSTDIGQWRRGLGMPRMLYAPDGPAGSADLAPGDIGRAEHILSLLGDDPDPAAEKPAKGKGAKAVQDAPIGSEDEEQPGSEAADDADEDADVEDSEADAADEPDADEEEEAERESEEDASEPPIDPPTSWSADAKKLFKTLPRDAQQVIADRERERDGYVSQRQQEVAETKKAHEADRTALQTERKTYAENLQTLAKVLQSADPILAQYGNADWGALYRQNPDKTGEINALKEDVQKRVGILNAIAAEHQRTAQQIQADEDATRNEKLKAAHEYLGERLDFWKDEKKREEFQKDLFSYLKTEYGLTPEQLNNVTDGPTIDIARKARLYDKLMAEQASIQERRTSQPKKAPKKVLRSQSSSERPVAAPQVQKLKARARQTGRIDDAAAAVLASL